MKLKLRVNSDDIKKLILFAIILLYLVSLAVVNLGELISSNEVHITLIPVQALLW